MLNFRILGAIATALADIAMAQDLMGPETENNTLTTTSTSQSIEKTNHLKKSNTICRNKIAVLNPN
jgi:hypothetical protein